MADVVEKVTGAQGLKYNGFSRAKEKDFRLNREDCAIYLYKIDAGSNTIPAVLTFQTDLKRALAGKVVKLGDAGVADASVTVVPDPAGKGKLKISGLNAYAAGQVFYIVAIGSRV